jgi:hypothetical protein
LSGHCDCKVLGSDHDEWCSSHPANVAKAELEEVAAERDRYREALEDIAKETGTPYARIAQKALDG